MIICLLVMEILKIILNSFCVYYHEHFFVKYYAKKNFKSEQVKFCSLYYYINCIIFYNGYNILVKVDSKKIEFF